jgi:hypothetical protein
VPQARVTAIDVATGVQTPVSSTSAGFYRVQNLEIGVYNVTVEHPGFHKYVREGLTLTTGDELGLNTGPGCKTRSGSDVAGGHGDRRCRGN